MREGSSDAGRGPHAIQHALSRTHCATQTRAHLFVAGLLVAREELRVEVRRIVLVEHLHHDRPPSAWESAPAPLRNGSAIAHGKGGGALSVPCARPS